MGPKVLILHERVLLELSPPIVTWWSWRPPHCRPHSRVKDLVAYVDRTNIPMYLVGEMRDLAATGISEMSSDKVYLTPDRGDIYREVMGIRHSCHAASGDVWYVDNDPYYLKCVREADVVACGILNRSVPARSTFRALEFGYGMEGRMFSTLDHFIDCLHMHVS